MLTSIRITWELVINADSHPHPIGPRPTQTPWVESQASALEQAPKGIFHKESSRSTALHTHSLFGSTHPVTGRRCSQFNKRYERPWISMGGWGILSQCIRTSNRHVVHFKYLKIFFVNYTSQSWKKNKVKEKDMKDQKLRSLALLAEGVSVRYDDSELPTETYKRGEKEMESESPD